MTKRRQIERARTATREVTVRLHGYPAYERRLSGHHPANWMVEIEFKRPEGPISTTIVFQSESYDAAAERWEMYQRITED